MAFAPPPRRASRGGLPPEGSAIAIMAPSPFPRSRQSAGKKPHGPGVHALWGQRWTRLPPRRLQVLPQRGHGVRPQLSSCVGASGVHEGAIMAPPRGAQKELLCRGNCERSGGPCPLGGRDELVCLRVGYRYCHNGGMGFVPNYLAASARRGVHEGAIMAPPRGAQKELLCRGNCERSGGPCPLGGRDELVCLLPGAMGRGRGSRCLACQIRLSYADCPPYAEFSAPSPRNPRALERVRRPRWALLASPCPP
jgi:hypothetical protein